jgi:hypothetical protein
MAPSSGAAPTSNRASDLDSIYPGNRIVSGADNRFAQDPAGSREAFVSILVPSNGKQTMRQATVVQNMRSGKFGGTIVLGSQCRDTIGETHWYIGILKGSGFRIRLVSKGELLGSFDEEETEVIMEAITTWESEPCTPPN